MSLKLALIGFLTTVSVAGIGTGSYFLLKDNNKETKKSDDRDSKKGQTNKGNQTSGGGDRSDSSPETGSPKVAGAGTPPSTPQQEL